MMKLSMIFNEGRIRIVAVLMLELVNEISFGGLAVPARELCDYFPESW